MILHAAADGTLLLAVLGHRPVPAPQGTGHSLEIDEDTNPLIANYVRTSPEAIRYDGTTLTWHEQVLTPNPAGAAHDDRVMLAEIRRKARNGEDLSLREIQAVLRHFVRTRL